MKRFIVLLMATSLILISSVSNAQKKQQPGEVKSMFNTNSDNDSYGYTFTDDPLNADGFGPNDATIKVRPKAARTTLIRPRVSFVQEMLRSVEEL